MINFCFSQSNALSNHEGRCTWSGAYDLLNYALACDSKFSKFARRHLVVTCTDQLGGKAVPVNCSGKIKWFPLDKIDKLLKIDFNTVRFSHSDSGKGLEND